jgi:hypothetical protein
MKNKDRTLTSEAIYLAPETLSPIII